MSQIRMPLDDRVVDHTQRARSAAYRCRLLALADRAGLFVDSYRAIAQMRSMLALHGLPA
jgi:hypothetical protein